MNAWLKIVLSGACLLSLLISQSVLSGEANSWLPPGSSLSGDTLPVKEFLIKGQKLEGDALLGKLLFNSPSLLGEKSVRIGLSCNSCHPNGHVNTHFYIPGLSGEPGTIDLTSNFWRKGTEDGKFNPILIPSLRNVRNTAPYGIQLNVSSLQAFTRHVIMDEFDGPALDAPSMNALVSYMNLLEIEGSVDLSKQMPIPPIIQLMKLLKEPLDNHNIEELEGRVFLIKEELNRRLTPGTETKLIDIVKSLNSIRNNVKISAGKAQLEYARLLAFVAQD